MPVSLSHKPFRKKPPKDPDDRYPLSASLRRINNDIQKRCFAAGLSLADRLLADPGLTKHERARVLALVADSEFKRGRFSEAAQIQLKVASKSLDHVALWLRPHVGNVRALLKMPDMGQALMMARHAVELAVTKMGDYDRQVGLADRELATRGALAVPPVPPRVSVVATRMGYLFLQEGEPEAAEEFFEKAIQASKGGANRARQGLAKIALARGDSARAMSVAVDAIRFGGYKAKTLPAWATVIAARRQLGGWKIGERMIRGLDVAPAGLRARTILTIVRELRKNDMRQWRDVAERWLKREGAHFPVIEAEIRKMMLSSAKAEPGNAPEKQEKAEQLLQVPGLSPGEWLAATKEWVRSSLCEGGSVHVQQLLAIARAKYGEEFVPKTTHSLALSCIWAKRHDLARPLLQANIQQLAAKDPQWGKSVWALARLESQLGEHASAAELYRQIFEEASRPACFRLQAQLRWVDAMMATGQPEALRQARPLMDDVLGNVRNPDVLMNFARQLATTSPEVADWSRELFEAGAALALRCFQEARHPSVAIDFLFRLARRQICDFDRAAEAIRTWEDMAQEKKEWLWSSRSSFWEYQGLLVRAYCMERRFDQAESFAKQWLQDPATPPVGVIHVGASYGQWLVRSRRMPEALTLFDRLIVENPTHPACALAWYWKALEAHHGGDAAERNRCATCLRRAVGLEGGIMQEKELCAKAALLLADLDAAKLDVRMGVQPPGAIQNLKLHILQDLALLQ